jgi:hypothetical protein
MNFTPKTLSGHVVHLKKGGEQWGRERFSMSVWDRGRVMRAVTEFDDRQVMREASWSVGPDWSAREAFTREIIAGEFVAQCWFRVDGTAVECEAFSQAMGRVSQRLEVGRPVDYLGLHTILADVLVAAARGCTEPGMEKPITCVTNSVGDYGVGGYYAQAVSPLVTYVGPEDITVRAGHFLGEHFRVRWSDLTPHYSDFWVTQGDFLPLRLLGAFGPVSYELAGIDRG